MTIRYGGSALRALIYRERVVAQDGVDAEVAVHDLRHAQVDDDRRERERVPAGEAELALHQLDHAVGGDLRGATEMLVEAEREPRAVDPRDRPLEPQVLAEVEGHLRFDGTLDRRPRDLAVALRGVAVAGGEECAVDGDRQEERGAGDELLAVDVAAPPARRASGVHARLGRRHAEHAEERRQPHRTARARAASSPSSSQRISCDGAANVKPQDPGRTSSTRTASVAPACAPRTSIGPASAWPWSSSGSYSGNLSPGLENQAAFGVAKRTESPGVDGHHRLELAREPTVQRPPLERKLVDQNASSRRAASTTRATDGMYASSICQYGYGTS